MISPILGRIRRPKAEFEIALSKGRKVKPKDFRSFFTQTMIDGGVPMAIASKMMGHVSEKTTQAHYCQLSVDRRRVLGSGLRFEQGF